MSDEAGLLSAIREAPADDLPRLVYADWLEDQGRHERGELIRLQLALARGIAWVQLNCWPTRLPSGQYVWRYAPHQLIGRLREGE